MLTNASKHDSKLDIITELYLGWLVLSAWVAQKALILPATDADTNGSLY